MTPTGIAGSRAVHLPPASRRYSAGRVCGHNGCTTILSIYNQAGTCYLHTPSKPPRLRGRSGQILPARRA
jgi:hypothetical protein